MTLCVPAGSLCKPASLISGDVALSLASKATRTAKLSRPRSPGSRQPVSQTTLINSECHDSSLPNVKKPFPPWKHCPPACTTAKQIQKVTAAQTHTVGQDSLLWVVSESHCGPERSSVSCGIETPCLAWIFSCWAYTCEWAPPQWILFLKPHRVALWYIIDRHLGENHHIQ